MSDILEQMLAKEILGDASSNTALELGGLFDSVGNSALKLIAQDAALPSSDRRYGMGDAIGAGLLTGLIGGGFESYGNQIKTDDLTSISSILGGGTDQGSLSDSIYGKTKTYADLVGRRKAAELEADTRSRLRDVGEKVLEKRVLEGMDRRSAQSDFLGGLSPEKGKLSSEEPSSDPGAYKSMIPKIASSVPTALQEKALQESGTFNALNLAFDAADRAFTQAEQNVNQGQYIDDVLPLGMKAPSFSNKARNYDSAVASLIGSLAPSVKGPLSDSDLESSILPFMPKPGEDQITRANKRELLKNFLATNAEPTPILEEYNVVPRRNQLGGSLAQPGAVPSAQYTPAQLQNMGYVKIDGGWKRPGPPRTTSGAPLG